MAAHPKKPPVVDEAFREWIRNQPCVALGAACLGPVDACHVKSRGAGGADPKNLFSACRKHHAEQHTLGIKSFGAKYGFSLPRVAQQIWIVYQIDKDCR